MRLTIFDPMIRPLLRLGRFVAEPRVAALWVTGLLGTMYVLQVWLQTGGGNDDAELMILSQVLAWGYDPRNPPLVTWVGWALSEALGPGQHVTRLCVIGALGLSYLFFIAAARLMIADRRLATLAGLTPMLTVHVGWYPYINYTHSIFLVMTLAATLWAGLRFLRTPTIGTTLVLGLAIGAGLLSKYSFPLFLVSFAAAAMLLPSIRRSLSWPRATVALLIGLAIAAPHFAWLVENLPAAQTQLDNAWQIGAQSHGAAVLAGLARLGERVPSLLGISLGVIALAFVPVLMTRGQAVTQYQAHMVSSAWWVLAAGLVTLCTFLVAIIGFGVASISTHHLFILLGLPVGLIGVLSTRVPNEPDDPETGRPALRSLWPVGSLGVATVGCAAAIPVVFILYLADIRASCSKCGLALPYDAYAQQIGDAGFERGLVAILASVHHMPSEQLMPWFPDSRFIRPADRLKADFRVPGDRPASEPPGDCLVLWNEDQQPDALAALLAGNLGGIDWQPTDAAAVAAGSATGLITGTDRPAPPLGFAILPGAEDVCVDDP